MEFHVESMSLKILEKCVLGLEEGDRVREVALRLQSVVRQTTVAHIVFYMSYERAYKFIEKGGCKHILREVKDFLKSYVSEIDYWNRKCIEKQEIDNYPRIIEELLDNCEDGDVFIKTLRKNRYKIRGLEVVREWFLGDRLSNGYFVKHNF